MAEKFPNLEKDMNLQIQENPKIQDPKWVNAKKPMPRHSVKPPYGM